MPRKTEELAYIAGIIDADGSIGLTRLKERRRTRPTESYYPRVGVVQCKLEAIELIQQLFGGKIHEKTMPKDEDWRNPTSIAFTSKDEVEEILKAILPFLRIKRKQAEKVLEFIAIRRERLSKKGSSKYTYGKEEKEIWQELRLLNQRGRSN